MHACRSTLEDPTVLFEQQLGAIAEIARAQDGGDLEVLSAGAMQGSAARALAMSAPAATGAALALAAGASSATAIADRASTESFTDRFGSPEPAMALATLNSSRAIGMRDFLVAVLPRVASLYCSECGNTARQWQEICPQCQTPGSFYSVYTSERRPAPELLEIVRQAAGGKEHHRALLAAASTGDTGAARQLADLGESAAANVLAELPFMKSPQKALDVLVEMGVGAFGQVLDSYCRLREDPIGGRAVRRIKGIGDLEDAVVLVARKLGPGVLPILHEYFERSISTLARLAVRVSLHLADTAGLDEEWRNLGSALVLEEARRLDLVSTVRLLVASDPEHRLITETFSDPTWRCEVAIAEAFKHVRALPALSALLGRRAIAPQLIEELMSRADDPGCAAAVITVISRLETPHALAFLPLATAAGIPPAIRERFAGCFAERVADSPAPLVERLGLARTPDERELRRAIVSCGTQGLTAIERAYTRRGRRLFGSLRPISRRQDLEVKLALAETLSDFARAGHDAARALARRLHEDEDEPEALRALGRAIAAESGA